MLDILSFPTSVINCTLIDSTREAGQSLAAMLGKTASFRLTATLVDTQVRSIWRSTESDFTQTPVFYVAMPAIADDLASLAEQGVKLIVVLSVNTADAAIAYDYNAVDFLSLPISEQRLLGCFDKLTRFIQQANNGYAESFHRLGDLTKTQRVVLRKIGEQKTTRQIADELFVSTKTVDTHRSNIRELLLFSERRPLTPFAILAVQQQLV